MLALKVNDRDNVATVFALNVQEGTNLEVKDEKGRSETVTSSGEIPYGHKVALRLISKGEGILKYGEVIGAASKDIGKGEHVHVHNTDSQRGRGDLACE